MEISYVGKATGGAAIDELSAEQWADLERLVMILGGRRHSGGTLGREGPFSAVRKQKRAGNDRGTPLYQEDADVPDLLYAHG